MSVKRIETRIFAYVIYALFKHWSLLLFQDFGDFFFNRRSPSSVSVSGRLMTHGRFLTLFSKNVRPSPITGFWNSPDIDVCVLQSLKCISLEQDIRRRGAQTCQWPFVNRLLINAPRLSWKIITGMYRTYCIVGKKNPTTDQLKHPLQFDVHYNLQFNIIKCNVIYILLCTL